MQPIHGLDDCDINLESQPVDKGKNKENMKEAQDIGRCVLFLFYSAFMDLCCPLPVAVLYCYFGSPDPLNKASLHVAPWRDTL